MSSLLTLSRVTTGKAGSPTGNSYVTNGRIQGGSPSSPTVQPAEEASCDVNKDAGSSGSLLEKGVWQFADGKSVTTKGILAREFVLVNPDCILGVIQTQNAPITKGFGDGQLAGPDDVEVLVNGVERRVERVEPTLGLIILENPVEAGAQVEVNYYYTSNPTIEFSEFNNPGYQFNQYGNPTSTNRFPLNSVFGPTKGELQPLEIGHRYTAFQRSYTSVMNDPTTLLFNEPPHAAGLPPLQRDTEPVSIFFEGDEIPQDGWEVSGPAVTTAEFEENLFIVDDQISGNDNVDGSPLFYRQDVDLSFPYLTNLNFRLKAFSYEKERDFTGISIGISDEEKLYFLGFLEVDGTKFVGFLGSQGDETLWESYHGLPATPNSRLVNGVPRNDRLRFSFRPAIEPGDNVFLDGLTYEVESISAVSGMTGYYDVILTSEMVASDVVQVFPEISYDILLSYRIFRNEKGEARAYYSGNPAPFAYIAEQDLPYEAEIFELLETNEIFFGSVSRNAKSRVGWDFVRYGIIPILPTDRAPRVYVDLSLNELPEENPVETWTLLDDQGYSTILEDEFLLLEQASRPSQGSFTYGRIEPFLTSQNRSDLQAKVRIDSYAGIGIPSLLTMADERREVTIGFFADNTSTSPTDYASYRVSQGKSLISDPNSISTKGVIAPVTSDGVVYQAHAVYSGGETFSDEGWLDTGFDNVESTFIDHYQNLDKADAVTAQATLEILFPAGNIFRDHALSSRLRFNSGALDVENKLGFSLGVDDAVNVLSIGFMEDAGTEKVVFLNKNGSIILDTLGDPLGAAFEWGDGEFHTYKVLRSDDTFSLFIDGEFYKSVTESDLSSSSRTTSLELFVSLEEEAIDVDVDYFFFHSTEYGQRKIGIFQGGDRLDPNSYEFVDTEWLGTFLDVQVIRDPDGSTQVFLNNDPTPVIEKQYNELPRRESVEELNTSLGYVRFGNADPRSLTESVWDYVRFSIQNVREDKDTLPHSVFNAAHVLSSPEAVFDETIEEVNLDSDTDTKIYLSSKGLKAKRVLSVKSEDGTASYTFDYDEASNEIEILNGPLPETRTTVVVRYLPQEPYGHNYLKDQNPVIQLNEGTPPFEQSLQKILSITQGFESNFNDFDDLLNEDDDFVFTDNKIRFNFSVNNDALYECLDLRSEELRGERGLLKPACDDQGLIDLTLGEYSDTYQIPDQAPDGAGTFEQQFILDDIDSELDGDEVMDLSSDAEIEIGVSDLREETYDVESDEALTGSPHAVLTVYDGLILDNFDAEMDNINDELDDYDGTDTPIDYTTTVNYP